MTATTLHPDVATRPFDEAENLARQTLYRYLGASLIDPQVGSWALLSDVACQRQFRLAAKLIRQLKDAVAHELSPGERPLAALDAAPMLVRLPPTAADLNAQYERIFGLLSVGPCPACESEYIHSKFTFQRSQCMADVSGFYSAFGLARSPLHPERPDHIALELEFMACLLGLERQAEVTQNGKSRARAVVCREAQARFLTEHLAWWVPAFARVLAHENPDGFYAAIGDFLAVLIPSERALLGVDAPRAFAKPTIIDPPEACEGCLCGTVGQDGGA